MATSPDHPPEPSLEAARAVIPLAAGGAAVVEREPPRATLYGPDPDDGRLLHPFLSHAAAMLARWNGREALHGGAFLTKAGAVGLLGERGCGKSTTLAALTLAGETVLSDDLVVRSGAGLLLSGPRALDLRPGGDSVLAVEHVTRPVRGSARERLALGPAPPQTPLAGVVQLLWSERTDLRRLAPGERLRALREHRVYVLPDEDPAALLDLAELPVWVLERPPSRAGLEATVELLRTLPGRA